MDFVAYEAFSEIDALPSPQPSLSLPLKSNIENISAKLSNFKDFKSLLNRPSAQDGSGDEKGSRLAEKYANLSLQSLKDSSNADPTSKSDSFQENRNRSDALSVRLGKALNPTLTDAQVRDLFSGLEIKSVNIESLLDPDVDGSMARKQLRGDVEADLVKSYSTYLTDFAKPIKALITLGDHLASLETLIGGTIETLSIDLECTSDLRSEVSRLTAQKDTLHMKKALLSSFRQQFSLNEYDQFLLESNDISKDFFAALNRAEQIVQSCSILLALDNPELGKRIMAKNNELINKANEKVLSFCKKSLSNMYSLYDPKRLSTLHLCFSHLKERPSQLELITNSFVESRSAALIEEFNLQASGSGASENGFRDSRPVYYSSHDPVRFVTDLLAYVHSLAANESEIVSGILESKQETTNTTNQVVKKILASLSKPLKAQIDQVVSLESKMNVLYQIYSHLELYLVMFIKIGDAEKISNTLEECSIMIREKMDYLLKNRLAAIRDSNSAKIDLSSDLQPPEWIIDYYSDILPILDSMSTQTAFGLPEDENCQFLELIVDKPIDIFEEHLISMSNSFSKRDIALFKLNFLDLVVSKIIPISLLGDKMLNLNLVIAGILDDVKEIQFQALLSDCNFTDYYNIMNMICPVNEDFVETSLYAPILENKLFTKDQIIQVNDMIQATLPTALLEIQSSLMKLNNPIMVNDIITEFSVRFIKFYKLFASVVEEYLGEALLTWSDLEISTLLGVELAYTHESSSPLNRE